MPGLSVHHALRGLILLLITAGDQRLAVGCFLLLLDERAASAAQREGNVAEAAALQVVLVADLGALHRQGDAGETDDGRTAEEKAGSVDGLVALEVAVLVDAVVRLAEGDAGETPGHQAEVDGVEAAEEGSVPVLGRLGRFGVDHICWLGEDIVKSLGPSLDVAIVNRTGIVLLGGGHCEKNKAKKQGTSGVSVEEESRHRKETINRTSSRQKLFSL